MAVEGRLARIEGILGQMDKRISEFREDFNRRLNHVESEIKEVRGSLAAEIRELRRMMIGILIPMWVTIILAIIFTQ